MSDITFLAASLRVTIEDLCFRQVHNDLATLSPGAGRKSATHAAPQDPTRVRHLIKEAAADLTLESSARNNEYVQMTQKLENQAHKIFSLNQELLEKNGYIYSLQKELQASSSTSDKIMRESERKEDFMKAIHSDIDSLKAVVKALRENFKQTRSELLLAKKAQYEHVQSAKEQSCLLTQCEKRVKELQTQAGEKDAKLTKQLARLDTYTSQVSSLQLELTDTRQSANRWATQAEEAQTLILELHTRVYEMQSKYASTESIVQFVAEGVKKITDEHQKLAEMYAMMQS